MRNADWLYYITLSQKNQGIALYIFNDAAYGDMMFFASLKMMLLPMVASCSEYINKWFLATQSFLSRVLYHILQNNSRAFRILASPSRQRRGYHQCEALYIISPQGWISSSRRRIHAGA